MKEKDIPQDYETDKEFLDSHSLVIVKEEYKQEKIDPHNVALYQMQSKSNRTMSSYDLINEYLTRSGKWIRNHPEIYTSYDIKTLLPNRSLNNATLLTLANIIPVKDSKKFTLLKLLSPFPFNSYITGYTKNYRD